MIAAIEWGGNRMIAVYIAVGFAIAGPVAWLIMRKAVRTRIRTEREVRDDPDIHDWLVVFNWTRKILYLPAVMVSLLACIMMYLKQGDILGEAVSAKTIGGVWFAVFFINFLVEEFEINLKIVLIAGLCVLVLFFWLHLLGWVNPFLEMFGKLSINMSAEFYLLLVLIWCLTTGISWIRGLFYYVVFTPNYMNLQWGPSESGSHVGREDYNTHIDTEDILERLMGFGRIVVIFKDQKRQPMTFLVRRIARRAQLLERVRGKFAFDLNAQAPRPATPSEPPAPPSQDQGPTTPTIP